MLRRLLFAGDLSSYCRLASLLSDSFADLINIDKYEFYLYTKDSIKMIQITFLDRISQVVLFFKPLEILIEQTVLFD